MSLTKCANCHVVIKQCKNKQFIQEVEFKSANAVAKDEAVQVFIAIISISKLNKLVLYRSFTFIIFSVF